MSGIQAMNPDEMLESFTTSIAIAPPLPCFPNEILLDGAAPLLRGEPPVKEQERQSPSPANGILKLAQKAQIAAVQPTNVINLVEYHGKALDP